MARIQVIFLQVWFESDGESQIEKNVTTIDRVSPNIVKQFENGIKNLNTKYSHRLQNEPVYFYAPRDRCASTSTHKTNILPKTNRSDPMDSGGPNV